MSVWFKSYFHEIVSGSERRRRVEGSEDTVGVECTVSHVTSFSGIVALNISSVGVCCLAL